jgi:hypothetical protein
MPDQARINVNPPIVPSIPTRLVRREGFYDIPFRSGGWGGARANGLAVAFRAEVGDQWSDAFGRPQDVCLSSESKRWKSSRGLP